jgi:hypothetical protein
VARRLEKEVQMKRGFAIAVAAVLAAVPLLADSGRKVQFTSSFRLGDCHFAAQGANVYFNLNPGTFLALEEEGDELTRVEITVLAETEPITVPGLGTVTTRVVQERETVDGEVVEISRNFFALCGGRNDLVYFGEDVDIYNEDGSITHEGAWRAGQPDGNGLAEPGILMPGTFLLGSRYFQELADGVALDRAEHVAMDLTVETEAGTFDECVQIRETTPLEPKSESLKIYCAGVGLVNDSGAELVEYSIVQ